MDAVKNALFIRVDLGRMGADTRLARPNSQVANEDREKQINESLFS